MLKWKILLLTFCFLSILVSISTVDALIQKITPSNDAYVQEQNPNSNYDETWLIISKSAPFTFRTCRTWLKFHVPSYATFQTARVYLYVYQQSGSNPTVSIHYSSNDSWSESSITWNNQPSYGGILDSKVVSGGKWYSWDVTDVVSAGDTVSFCLETKTSTSEAKSYSKEYTSNNPYLQLYTPKEEEEQEEEEDAITLQNVPLRLGEKWGISTFAAGLFTSTILMFAFLFPLVIWEKSGIIVLVVAFSVMGFLVAIGWLPYWIMLMVSLFVVAMYSHKIKEMM